MDLFKARDDVDEYNDLLAEVERLRAIIGDQQILLDEHRMDNQHAFDEGGHAERAAVVAWLRGEVDAAMNMRAPVRAATFLRCAEAIERSEHRSQETK